MVSKHNKASQYQSTIDATSLLTKLAVANICRKAIVRQIRDSGTLIDVLVLIIVTIISGTMVFNAYIIIGPCLTCAA